MAAKHGTLQRFIVAYKPHHVSSSHSIEEKVAGPTSSALRLRSFLDAHPLARVRHATIERRPISSGVGGGLRGLRATSSSSGVDSGPFFAQTALGFLDPLVNPYHVPSAAAPRGLPASQTPDLVTHDD
ncbi:hypothetical protein L484_007101 [Morus notabilis]|uniref:Uncharacterized protein n=1 Tax=Morus notabilis TaxID=981085 RepID=W9S2E7_9ROSA|nr:hypothetical protein L484_007101 [Morus notabilis]